jgi:hypothetical protein
MLICPCLGVALSTGAYEILGYLEIDHVLRDLMNDSVLQS